MISITYILSQVFIIISYILLAITYQIKNRKSILILSFMSIAATGLSYLFLSAYSGLAMVIVAAIRNVIFVVDEKKNGKRLTNTTKDYIILAILYLISIIFAVFTYNGILSMISVVATMLYTYSVWQKNTKVYKILGLPGAVLWITYNIYIGSIFGLILEIILGIATVIGCIREFKEKKW